MQNKKQKKKKKTKKTASNKTVKCKGSKIHNQLDVHHKNPKDITNILTY